MTAAHRPRPVFDLPTSGFADGLRQLLLPRPSCIGPDADVLGMIAGGEGYDEGPQEGRPALHDQTEQGRDDQAAPDHDGVRLLSRAHGLDTSNRPDDPRQDGRIGGCASDHDESSLQLLNAADGRDGRGPGQDRVLLDGVLLRALEEVMEAVGCLELVKLDCEDRPRGRT